MYIDTDIHDDDHHHDNHRNDGVVIFTLTLTFFCNDGVDDEIMMII